VQASNLADQWYFAWDGKTFGPFSAPQLKELAGLGRLQPTDTVWKEGTARVLAARVNHLFPDPKTSDIPQKAIVPAYSSQLKPPRSLSSAQPGAAVKLTSWLPPASDLVTSGEELDIPDGLMLRAISDDDSASPVLAPIRTNERATAVSGAVIVGQDEESVRYRKKCSKCGHTSSAITTMPIRNEVTRTSFYCPKCRKLRDVVIQGTAP
jgi:hypothetical protein